MSIPTIDKEMAMEMLSNISSCSQLVCEQVFAPKPAVSEAHFPLCQLLPRITQIIRHLSSWAPNLPIPTSIKNVSRL